jgi:hypothetical protein
MDEQREALSREVFNVVAIDGKSLVAIEPKPDYAPLFAAMLIQNPVGYCEMEPTPSHNTQLFLPSRIAVIGIDSWAEHFSKIF